MNGEQNDMYVALEEIAEVADQALEEYGAEQEHGHGSSEGQADELPSCTPKTLPDRLLLKAAEVAFRLNPTNVPAYTTFGQPGAAFEVMEPQRIAVLTSKYWGPQQRTLTVSFMESTSPDLCRRIVSHMNAWTNTAGISFVWTRGTGQVRISRGSGGYYSYLGTDILLVPKNRQTMNLEGFTMNTPESEFRRVVRHETGHTLGCPHEHMRKALVQRIDPQKAYAYFGRTQGWDKAMVDAQVLTSLDERSLMGTPADQTSIMCYQIPGSLTRDGKPILGGLDINATDYSFIGQLYPKHGTSALEKSGDEPTGSACGDDDWDESEDVNLDFSQFNG